MQKLASLLIGLLVLGLAACVDPVGPQPSPSPSPTASPAPSPEADGPAGPTQSTPYFGTVRQIAPVAGSSLGASSPDWYRQAPIYHLWVNAFKDSNGDGVGDLRGVIQNLDYLQGLGIGTIWLSPFFANSSPADNRHGYDVTNHYEIDPAFGTLAEVEELLQKAHALGLRVIFDWVPNHVSTQHPWFLDSLAGRNGRAGWFWWKNSRPGGWTGMDANSDWHLGSNYRYYYGVFGSGMPDINYQSPGARAAMVSALVYWLNLGFDGMRVDAVKYLFENQAGTGAGSDFENNPASIEFFQKLRSEILDAYGTLSDGSGRPYHKFMVAENWTTDEAELLQYQNQSGMPAFQMTLDFPFALASSAGNFGWLMAHWSQVQANKGMASYGSFLSNHDNCTIRPGSQFKDWEPLLWAVSALNFCGPGVPVVYYGNETAQPETGSGLMQNHDDRDSRRPLDWSRVSSQEANTQSHLNYLRALAALRSAHPALRDGDFSAIQASDGILVFRRDGGGESLIVAINASDSTRSVTVNLAAAPSGASTVFGSDQLVLSGSALSFNAMLPGACRVAKLNDAGGTSAWSDPVLSLPPASMFFRGSSNAWGASAMGGSPSHWQISLGGLTVGSTLKFKFDRLGDWKWSYGYYQLSLDSAASDIDSASTDPDGNFVFTVPSASLTIHFNQTGGLYWATTN